MSLEYISYMIMAVISRNIIYFAQIFKNLLQLLLICGKITVSGLITTKFLEDKIKMETIIGIILLVAAVFLIASVLLQSSKSHKLPGAIAGGAETFFGKTKGSKIDHALEIATAVVAIVFCLLVIALYVTQETIDYSALPTDPSTVETQDISAMIPETDAGDETTGETANDTVDGETSADVAVDTEADAALDTEADVAAETEADAGAETAAEAA